ncbi:MAG: helix-turn-helix domain-containing protein [Enterocloster aldenensis]
MAISKRSISMYENGNRKPDYETLKKSLISSMRI